MAQHNPSLPSHVAGSRDGRGVCTCNNSQLGVWFDILGMALETPGDVVRATFREQPGATLDSVSGDGGKLPRAAGRNTACVAAQLVLERLGAAGGVSLQLEKGLPLASGLGSSAASAAAATVATNALFGSPLSLTICSQRASKPKPSLAGATRTTSLRRCGAGSCWSPAPKASRITTFPRRKGCISRW